MLGQWKSSFWSESEFDHFGSNPKREVKRFYFHVFPYVRHKDATVFRALLWAIYGSQDKLNYTITYGDQGTLFSR